LEGLDRLLPVRPQDAVAVAVALDKEDRPSWRQGIDELFALLSPRLLALSPGVIRRVRRGLRGLAVIECPGPGTRRPPGDVWHLLVEEAFEFGVLGVPAGAPYQRGHLALVAGVVLDNQPTAFFADADFARLKARRGAEFRHAGLEAVAADGFGELAHA